MAQGRARARWAVARAARAAGAGAARACSRSTIATAAVCVCVCARTGQHVGREMDRSGIRTGGLGAREKEDVDVGTRELHHRLQQRRHRRHLVRRPAPTSSISHTRVTGTPTMHTLARTQECRRGPQWPPASHRACLHPVCCPPPPPVASAPTPMPPSRAPPNRTHTRTWAECQARVLLPSRTANSDAPAGSATRARGYSSSPASASQMHTRSWPPRQANAPALPPVLPVPPLFVGVLLMLLVRESWSFRLRQALGSGRWARWARWRGRAGPPPARRWSGPAPWPRRGLGVPAYISVQKTHHWPASRTPYPDGPRRRGRAAGGQWRGARAPWRCAGPPPAPPSSPPPPRPACPPTHVVSNLQRARAHTARLGHTAAA
jgi:hypothetical protein